MYLELCFIVHHSICTSVLYICTCLVCIYMRTRFHALSSALCLLGVCASVYVYEVASDCDVCMCILVYSCLFVFHVDV